jgi:hypothetical protein
LSFPLLLLRHVLQYFQFLHTTAQRPRSIWAMEV